MKSAVYVLKMKRKEFEGIVKEFVNRNNYGIYIAQWKYNYLDADTIEGVKILGINQDDYLELEFIESDSYLATKKDEHIIFQHPTSVGELEIAFEKFIDSEGLSR